MRTDPVVEALEFAAVTLSSDWPARCQEIVWRARAALADPAPDAHTLTVELRTALGMFAGAMPISQKEAWDQAIARVREIRDLT